MPRHRTRIIDRHDATPVRANNQSAVANGTRLLPVQDARGTWARIMRSTMVTLINHCGGDDVISETKRITARRVAALEAELVFAEDRIAQLRNDGDPVPDAMLTMYGTLADRQRRLNDALGWARTSRDVTQDLNTYLRSRDRGHHHDHEDA